LNAAWVSEWVKLRRSRLPLLTLIAMSVGAAAGGLFMFIALDPERARGLGLLGDKAQVFSLEASWPSFFGLLAQIAAVGGLLIFGLTAIWVFGREFAGHTFKDLLALPTTRAAIVSAKFAVHAVWCLLLAFYLLVIGVGIGLLLGITGSLSAAMLGAGIAKVLGTALLTIALTTVFGLAASMGRGYLAAVGALFAVLFAAQIMAALGYGAWFPFSVPAQHAGLAGGGAASPGGYLALCAVAAGSVLATVSWWRRADHTG
jgi:ABC-2 type transport system permease protein